MRIRILIGTTVVWIRILLSMTVLRIATVYLQTNLKTKYWLVFTCFWTNYTGCFTDLNLVWCHGLCGGCCQNYLQKTPKIDCKVVKMINNHLKMTSLSSWTEMTDKDRLMPLYFNGDLPEPLPREKIPQASIIVSRTWKLRFTSYSISRFGIRLVFYLCSRPAQVWKHLTVSI